MFPLTCVLFQRLLEFLENHEIKRESTHLDFRFQETIFHFAYCKTYFLVLIHKCFHTLNSNFSPMSADFSNNFIYFKIMAGTKYKYCSAY